jgi:excisionase family DNA binding protein
MKGDGPRQSKANGNAQMDDPLERWAAGLGSQSGTSTPVARRKAQTAERPRTVAEAADELGLSVHTVRAWIADRRIGHLRLGRAIRIPASEIRRVIHQSTVPAVREE